MPQPPAPPLPQLFRGSLRLFRMAGTDVFVHWSWFLVAVILLRDRPVPYSSIAWDVAEYVAGFGLVLLHEFGHVLACRSVGGAADRILLWPLGGLALVAPPPRPGANLWTTAAGPLVNAALAPVLIGLAFATAPGPDDEAVTDLYHLFRVLAWFNVVMLVLNLLPIFPLDGGRIMHAVLWYGLGRGPGLALSAGVGLVAALALFVLAAAFTDWLWIAMTGFLALGAYGGLKQARALIRLDRMEARPDRSCPHCQASPRIGPCWTCLRCRNTFDAFDTGFCPGCGASIVDVPCTECGRPAPASAWARAEEVPVTGGTTTTVPNAPWELVETPPETDASPDPR